MMTDVKAVNEQEKAAGQIKIQLYDTLKHSLARSIHGDCAIMCAHFYITRPMVLEGSCCKYNMKELGRGTLYKTTRREFTTNSHAKQVILKQP